MGIVVLVFLNGCDGIQARQTMQNERVLVASGFQMRFADTPQKISELQALPQCKLLMREKGRSNLFFVCGFEGL